MTNLTRRKKELLNSYNNLCSCYGDIISEQTKTINQLKELLKECKQMFVIEKSFLVKCLRLEDIENIITKIDNAIGEKK